MKYDCKTCAVAARQSISLAGLFKGRKHGKAETAQATVSARRVAPARFPTQDSTWDYLVTFALADGKSLELCATEEAYQALKEGAAGQLTWQGQDLLEFTERT